MEGITSQATAYAIRCTDRCTRHCTCHCTGRTMAIISQHTPLHNMHHSMPRTTPNKARPLSSRPWALTTVLCYSLLTTHFSLLTTHCSLLTTHYSLPTSHYSLLTTYRRGCQSLSLCSNATWSALCCRWRHTCMGCDAADSTILAYASCGVAWCGVVWGDGVVWKEVGRGGVAPYLHGRQCCR